MWRKLILPLLLVAASPSSATAQTCAPSSAEHAFEELLVALVDDSPQEREAWRITDEQEAKGAFESEETIRRLDELADREGLAYDCGARTYRPVSGGPTPAEIEEAREEEEEEEEEASELAEGRGGRPAPGGGGAPGGAVGLDVPGGPDGPVPGGEGPLRGGHPTLPAGGDEGRGPAASGGGTAAADPAGAGKTRSSGSPDTVPRVPDPGEAPTGSAVAALASDDDPAPMTAATRWLLGTVLVAGLAAGGGILAGSRRRRRAWCPDACP